MSNLNAVLNERGKRYGEFKDQAVYADKLNDTLMSSPNWAKMKPDQRESLRLIANKLARICNGDPDYDDSWIDIAGYAQLVADRLKKDQAPKVVGKRATHAILDCYEALRPKALHSGDGTHVLSEAEAATGRYANRAMNIADRIMLDVAGIHASQGIFGNDRGAFQSACKAYIPGISSVHRSKMHEAIFGLGWERQKQIQIMAEYIVRNALV